MGVPRRGNSSQMRFFARCASAENPEGVSVGSGGADRRGDGRSTAEDSYAARNRPRIPQSPSGRRMAARRGSSAMSPRGDRGFVALMTDFPGTSRPLQQPSDSLADLASVVRGVLRARSRDQHLIEDLTQETLIRLATTEERLTPDAQRAYAIVTARNLLTSHARPPVRTTPPSPPPGRGHRL